MFCTNCGHQNSITTKFCASCGAPTTLANKETTGKINIIRKKKSSGRLFSYKVFVDGCNIGILKNGETVSTIVGYGEHKIKIISPEENIIKNIIVDSEHKVANITIAPSIGFVTARPVIKEVKYTEK